jgi:hypothetical protein
LLHQQHPLPQRGCSAHQGMSSPTNPAELFLTG